MYRNLFFNRLEKKDILGKNRLRRLGFNIPVGKVTARQAVMLNKAAEELPSESDITVADDIELQGIAEKASDIISHIRELSFFSSQGGGVVKTGGSSKNN